tara:strand:- start:7555 stop:7659 length:105 start_codon:yes stop_codon:yes gene_type:complete
MKSAKPQPPAKPDKPKVPSSEEDLKKEIAKLHSK